MALGAVVGFLYAPFRALAQMMGRGGMMGGMGHGMMGMSSDADDASSSTENSSPARELLAYLQNQELQCMQCHAMSKDTFAPSFATLSARFAGKKDALVTLTDHIAHGVRNMPPGLANEQQARECARLILNMAEASK